MASSFGKKLKKKLSTDIIWGGRSGDTAKRILVIV